MLSRFRWQVRGLAGRIRQLSLGLSVCRPSARAEIHSPPGPAGCSLPPWIGPRSPLFLYLDCPAGSAKRLGGAAQGVPRPPGLLYCGAVYKTLYKNEKKKFSDEDKTIQPRGKGHRQRPQLDRPTHRPHPAPERLGVLWRLARSLTSTPSTPTTFRIRNATITP